MTVVVVGSDAILVVVVVVVLGLLLLLLLMDRPMSVRRIEKAESVDERINEESSTATTLLRILWTVLIFCVLGW